MRESNTGSLYWFDELSKSQTTEQFIICLICLIIRIYSSVELRSQRECVANVWHVSTTLYTESMRWISSLMNRKL